jgi:membrane-associated phospholipid phosphatase
MKNKKINSISLALDLYSVLLGLFFLSLIIYFSHKLQDWVTLSFTTLLYLMVYIASCSTIKNIKNDKTNLILHTSIILVLFSYYFQLAGSLQHILFDGWFDETLISLARFLVGYETSLVLEKITNPVLTEWMMFSYVAYIPLLFAVSFICYFSSDLYSSKEYLFNLICTYSVCYLGFIIFPVASPLFHYPEAYNVKLDGGIFSICGELIRKYGHFPGGSLPSPHCAATTVMAISLYKHNRKIFYWLLPVFVSIYISTVYGRYHYSWDVIAGIIIALIVIKLTPKILVWFDSIIENDSLIALEEIKTIPVFQGGLK